jgi:hypothetical protein
MDKADAADPRKHCDDYHYVEIAVRATARSRGLDLVVPFHSKTVDKDQEECSADKIVAVEVAGRPEKHNQQQEPDGADSYLSGLAGVDNVGDEIGHVERDENEREEPVPESATLLQVQVVLVLHLLLLPHQQLQLLL